MPDFRDDSDVKIAGKTFGKKEESFDALQLIEETKTQRFNGNTAKAKILGANIVSAFSYKAAPEELRLMAKEKEIELKDDVLLQLKILSVFSAEYCLKNFLPSPMLSSVAIGELYDVLDRVSPDFYRELSTSTAFSFYYMSLRRGGNISAEVGRQFAMLCGKKDDKSFIEFGEKMHEVNVSVFKKAIKGFAFI